MNDCKHIHLTMILNPDGGHSTNYVCNECRLHFHALPGMKPITVTYGEPPTQKCVLGYSMSETCVQCARHYSETERPVSGTVNVCSLCGEPTDHYCDDCKIDLGTIVYVCNKLECRDQHVLKSNVKSRPVSGDGGTE